MKNVDDSKVITGLVEKTPFAEEGWIVAATEQNGDFDSVLPGTFPDDMAAAELGDSRAWGRLYQMLSSYLMNGTPVPRQLGAFMAKRTIAISSVLLTEVGDRRKELPNAVAPGAKRGRKKEKLDLEDMLALEAIQAAGKSPTEEKLLKAVEYVVSKLPRKPDLDTPTQPFTAPATLPLSSVKSILIKAKLRLG